MHTASKGFERLYALLSLTFIAGIFTDGWAHNHLPSALETFFTPWHAIMYGGFASLALLLAVTALRGKRKGRAWLSVATWRDAMPHGYFASLVGAAIFTGGGAFDLVWHSLFGIEANIDALVSPAHLILGVGAFLMLSGPFRSAWSKPGADALGWREALPLAISAAASWSVLTFLTMFAHPVRLLAGGLPPRTDMIDFIQGRAVGGVLFQMTLLSGLALLVARRWTQRLPYGFFGLVFGLNMAGMSMVAGEGYETRLIPAAFVAGLLADDLFKTVRPFRRSRAATRWFAALVPAAYVLALFGTVIAHEGVWWSVHLWTGTVALAGVVGLLVSLAMQPPDAPQE